jgi:hypothetical protein
VRRPVSQVRTSTGSDERGQYDKGTRPPGGLEHLAYGLVLSCPDAKNITDTLIEGVRDADLRTYA